MKLAYTNETNAQLIIYLLKAYNIKKVVASPGAVNIAFLASLQSDSFFEIYSSVDERSAAYMACGLAETSGEPVVLTCTGATASRNYIPGLTEAYYRKLPILAITCIRHFAFVGHDIPQVMDRTNIQNDIANLSVAIPQIHDETDLWDCEVKVNQAMLALNYRGGGPVHINLATKANARNDVETLPNFRQITRILPSSGLPSLNGKKLAIFIGSHARMSAKLTGLIDRFCETYDSVVFCDHSSNYYGKYKVNYSILGKQSSNQSQLMPQIIIRLGNICGDYDSAALMSNAQEVWRVNQDGKLVDTYRKLRYVFEMSDEEFFSSYEKENTATQLNYYTLAKQSVEAIRKKIPELPFSNVWIAQQGAPLIPKGSYMHFAILNSLRAWNFFELPDSVQSMANVGGFGIDGCASTLIGNSLISPEKLHYLVIGDLAFFYDMNVLGNRHNGKNLRILLINNGVGTEFKNYFHDAARLGDYADEFVAARGHFGQQSKNLVRHYAQDLGFTYLSAGSKEEFNAIKDEFFNPALSDHSIVLEVFTNSEEESEALHLIHHIEGEPNSQLKNAAKKLVGNKGISLIKKFVR